LPHTNTKKLGWIVAACLSVALFLGAATKIDLANTNQVTGILSASFFPALTGDVTNTSGSLATTVGASHGITFPATCATGDIVYGSSSSAYSCDTNYTANALIKFPSSAGAPSSSSIIDNAVTIVTTEPIVTGNSITMTGAGTVTSSSFVTFTTNTLVLPTVPISTTRRGYCDIVWQTSATADTPTFAFNTNNALTGLWIQGAHYYSSTSATTNLLPPAVITTATQTAFTAALTAANANISYQVHVDFSLQTNGSNTEQITVYAKINGGTLTIEPGSGCAYLP